MKVIACVINWNSGELIGNCLDSLEPQRLDEVLVIDNNSKDESPDIAEGRGVKVIRNSKNAGYAAAVNQALRYADSVGADFSLIMNPDVRLSPDAAERLADALAERPKAAVASPLVVSEDTGLVEAAWYEFNFRQLIVVPRGQGDAPQKHSQTLVVPAVSGVAWMIRLSAFREVGELNEELFLYHEDMEWCYRASMKGYCAILVAQAHAYHVGFRADPKGQAVKSYFLGRNSVLFAKRWLKGYRGLKFWAFLLASVPLYSIRGVRDRGARRLLKGALDGLRGKISASITNELDI